MLNSFQKLINSKLVLLLTLSALFLVSSCLPTSTAPSVNQGSVNNSGTSTTTNTNYSEPTFPLNGIFVQEGANRSLSTFSLPFDFGDSFLIRGKALSQFLRTVPNTTKFCLVGKYTYVPSKDRFLILAAKPKSYTDLAAKTTEFYLQVEPSNDTANQNDCLNYNLTNTLFTNASNPTAHFSLTQLCSNCTTAVTSGGLKLYFYNGETVPVIATDSLVLTISGATSTSTNTCSDSTACQARGYDCCLESQCVSDGAVRPGAMSLAGFTAAQEDVRLNPDRFTVYPQFYFVCLARPDGTGSSSGSTTDPEYEASVRILELTQLYNCLNPVDGEFSYCSLKFTQANKLMPGTFSASSAGFNDDINFSNLNPALAVGDKVNNIVKIIYGGQVFYEQGATALASANGSFVSGSANDNITSSQSVQLSLTLPTNAKDANLYLTYKIDGTCEKISTTIAKCSKTYIQGHSDTNSTYWHDNSKTYFLPDYADTSSTSSLIVKVAGIVVPEDTSTWTKAGSPNRIVFSSSYNIYQNQTIEITYFITNNASEVIKLKTAAQAQVNSICTCASGVKCNLKALKDAGGNVTNYECTYPSSTSTEPPANQTVYVSAKSIPHRYFDANGVSYDEDYGTALDQELTAFAYTNNDVLKPNNVNQYVGFNEIYGSFAKTGTYIAKPAKKVSVKKDKLYDIVVNSGSFSSCVTCGTDYYSTLQKIFPSSFSGQGGGYSPDKYASQRENSSSLYRGDDLAFGRACFVPATMIPWTHASAANVRDQRRNRLMAQHFLFANGYNRDWFGYDYGSLIGSFDGVTWFSIGNQRRIKATSNKLYLAVNSYFGDLNVDNNFNVAVMETTAFSSEIPDHDTETDGAQCQKSHFCSNDNDCFRQLGYDYSCQNVSTLTTTWPQFDSNGSEVTGSSTRSLLSLVNGANGQSKRCVYRGRGAPCHQDIHPTPLETAITFNNSALPGTLMCSSNNSCVPLTTTNRFNDRIARFANTPIAQNSASAAPTVTDTVGLGARVIMRPFNYYGTSSVPAGVNSNLIATNVKAICVPGKDIASATDNLDLSQKHPSNRTNTSDKIWGVGPVLSSNMSPRNMNACPATDAAGTTLATFDLPLGSPLLNMFTIAQNLSSNLLNLTPLKNQKVYSSTNGSQVTTLGYQNNTCLRAAGASCFSDLECAPSYFIATKAKAAAADLRTIIGMNDAEVAFWQEDLTCGNPDFKRVNDNLLNPEFDVKKNKCCREFGKTMTVYTEMMSGSTHKWCDAVTASNPTGAFVAGTFQDINSTSRYSRTNQVFDKMTCNPSDPELGASKSFALSIKAPDTTTRLTQILTQFKTLDTLNQRTCCTNHWVRSFSADNGGGHTFGPTKLQNIDKTMFKHVSWLKDDKTSIGFDPDTDFECEKDNYPNVSCEIKSLTQAEEDLYLSWAASLELVGIPQAAVKTNDSVFMLVDDTQSDIASLKMPLIEMPPSGSSVSRPIMKSVYSEGEDFKDASTGKLFYSAASYDKLNMTGSSKNNMKKVFSENEFNCCIPAGQEIPTSVTPQQCCTGSINNLGAQPRCCLADYTDITLYLNRYVSSEGRGLPDSAYDAQTGYIKDPGMVRQIANAKNLCCSGTLMTGVAISNMSIPIMSGRYLPGVNVRRLNYSTTITDTNADNGSIGLIFDKGVRWNNHVYCVPAGMTTN